MPGGTGSGTGGQKGGSAMASRFGALCLTIVGIFALYLPIIGIAGAI